MRVRTGDPVKAFSNKEKRKQIFDDYMSSGENLETCMLYHKRRIVQAKLAKAVYRPKTQPELMARYQDEDYVQLIIADCEKRKRFEKDKFAPNDATKVRYWVLDDESLEFSSAQELEFMLECQTDIAQEDASLMAADGAFFSSAGDIGTGGAGTMEVARLGDLHSKGAKDDTGNATQQRSKTSKNKTATGEGKGTGAGKGSGEGKGTGAAEVFPETSLQRARKTCDELTTHIGAGSKLVLELGRADASDALVQQINDTIAAMKEQHKMIDQRLPYKIENPPDYYNSMCDNATKQVMYFKNRCAYAKALVGVTKREEKAKAPSQPSSAHGK